MSTKTEMIRAIRSLNNTENEAPDPAFEYAVLSANQMASIYSDCMNDSVFIYDLTLSEGVLKAKLNEEVYEPRAIEKYRKLVT